jgi:hypothetical protein
MSVHTIRRSFIVGIVIFLGNITVPFAQQTNLQPTVTIPRFITISGVLRTGSGVPLTGVFGVRFALYSAQQGGVPLWSEIQNVNVDEQERYSASLGATQPVGLPIELFRSNEPRWLGVHVQIAGEDEQPRLLLVSVPYAMKAADADTIGGRPASAFVLAGDSVTQPQQKGGRTSPVK